MHPVAAAVCFVAGVFVVGPCVTHAVVRWIGWQVAVPRLLGWTPQRDHLGSPVPRCRRCAADLRVGRALPLRALPWSARLGRCSRCREPLDRRWLGVEAATGLLLGAAGGAAGWSRALLPVAALFTGLVAMCAVDLTCSRIPTRFAWLTGVAAGVGVLVASAGDHVGTAVVASLAGSVAFGGVLALLHLVSPRVMGFGDVRLSLVAGLVVGWSAWRAGDGVAGAVASAASALLIACLLGAAVGAVLLARRRRDAPFPFGPALALGAVVQVVANLMS